MDCYKVLSPSLESLFAIRSLASFVSVAGPTLIWHLISNWRRITPVKTDSGFSPSPTKHELTPFI